MFWQAQFALKDPLRKASCKSQQQVQLLFILFLAAGIEIDGQVESDTQSEGNVEIKQYGLVLNPGGDIFPFSLWVLTCSTMGTIL